MSKKLETLKTQCQDQLASDIKKRVDRISKRRFAPFRVFRIRRLLRIVRKALG